MPNLCNDIVVKLILLLKEFWESPTLDKIESFQSTENSTIALDKADWTNQKEINNHLKRLYLQSSEEDFYWIDCPLHVYKNTVNERLNNRRQIDFEKSIMDIMLEDFNILLNIHMNRVLVNYGNSYHSLLNSDNRQRFNAARDAKVDYIKKEINKHGYFLDPTVEGIRMTPINMLFEHIDNDEEVFDLNKTAKVVFAQKLGIIEFLRTQKNVTYAALMAKILAKLMGEPQSTLQSMINPMFKPDVGQKNNPLYSAKSVENVEDWLRKNGIDIQ